MVDEKYQGMGFGRSGMRKIIEVFRADERVKAVGISYKPDNDVARRLYASLGFLETGDRVGKEVLAVLNLGNGDDGGSPNIGDVIFVDDIDLTDGTFIAGGKATISAIRLENGQVYVSVHEVPGASWLWSNGLSARQEPLQCDRVAGNLMIRMANGSIQSFG
jgi:hypothetical protein